MKLILCLLININVFFKLTISFWACLASHAQSTQNNKFAISFQNFKEKLKNEVDFFPEDKDKRFLQIDTITLCVFNQACLNYPK